MATQLPPITALDEEAIVVALNKYAQQCAYEGAPITDKQAWILLAIQKGETAGFEL